MKIRHRVPTMETGVFLIDVLQWVFLKLFSAASCLQRDYLINQPWNRLHWSSLWSQNSDYLPANIYISSLGIEAGKRWGTSLQNFYVEDPPEIWTHCKHLMHQKPDICNACFYLSQKLPHSYNKDEGITSSWNYFINISWIFAGRALLKVSSLQLFKNRQH